MEFAYVLKNYGVDVTIVYPGVVATDIRLPSLYADPRWVRQKARAAVALAPLLERPAAAIYAELEQPRGFIWLATTAIMFVLSGPPLTSSA